MYFFYDFRILAALVLCMILSAWANHRVRSAYKKYGAIPNARGLTGYDTATRLLNRGEVYDVSVGRVSGELSDHYHPAKGVVNLSDGVYSKPSVAAVAIAAHEVGHVMQHKKGYLFYKLRTAIVPVTNIGTKLALPLVFIGLILEMGTRYGGSDTGFMLAMVGVALYGLSFLFTLVTLPVELNASHRAKQMLLEEGVLSEEEIPGATSVLSAAALTYLASMLTSFVYFLRFFLYVLSMFGGRNRR